MPKLLPIVLTTTALLFSITQSYNLVSARTCVAATSCGRQPIKFVPGQRITVEVANLTGRVIQLQQFYGADPQSITPGQVRSFARGGTTEPNFSVVMWDAIGRPLKIDILKPSARKLRIEMRSGGYPPGDRSVYLRDDGRVTIF